MADQYGPAGKAAAAEHLPTHEWHETRHDLERQIRSNPLASVAVAFGAGFLLAQALVGSRKRHSSGQQAGRRGGRRQALAPIRRAVISGLTTLLVSRLRERIMADSNGFGGDGRPASAGAGQGAGGRF